MSEVAEQNWRAVDLINDKRLGHIHTPNQVRWLVERFMDGTVDDAQMAAWCMAVMFHPLADEEIDSLCDAMVASGDTVDLSDLAQPAVDKHSTGGVGDKVTLALAPLVAACGVPMAKMSGRGLGHTGGTLDKLEAIPGFCIGAALDDVRRLVAEVGCCVVAQSDRLVPADQKLYALRDVTATVASPGLIATSIMSKKLAAGAHAMVLDVKVGNGAFMETVGEARNLARIMHGLGTRAGRHVRCELTRMEEPLGRAVGNALEVEEAFAVLHGTAPPDITSLVRSSAAQLLELSQRCRSLEEADALVVETIHSGAAAAKARQWVAAQGGNPAVVDDQSTMEMAPVVVEVPAPVSGYVRSVPAIDIGLAAMRLGAGRARKTDDVDHAVGIVLAAKAGERVEVGQPLATVHARTHEAALACGAELVAAYQMSEQPVDVPDLVIDTIGP